MTTVSYHLYTIPDVFTGLFCDTLIIQLLIYFLLWSHISIFLFLEAFFKHHFSQGQKAFVG